MIRVAVIGFGVRSLSVMRSLKKWENKVQLAAIADKDLPAAKKRLADSDLKAEQPRYYDSADELLRDADSFDALFIGTRCDEHTPIAVKAAATDLPLFLEKPVATTNQQLTELADAFRGRDSKVVVSFPLRVTPLCRKATEIIRSGRLGAINQIHAFNFVNYGGVYYGQWYRDYDITGGLWLQKATHDFDYIHHLAAADPVAIAAMHTRNIFGGDKPENLRCSTCDETDTCPESPKNSKLRGDDGNAGKDDHFCMFSKAIKHQDAGSALVLYADGTHSSYSQNFVTRRRAHGRGARITGYLGTLHFDWATNVIRLTEHHGDKVEELSPNAGEDHFGGDEALCKNFLAVIQHQAAPITTLNDGLISAATCLAARTSAETQSFQKIAIPGQTPTPLSSHRIIEPSIQ
jgi:predicted dehydrogenase